MDGLVFLLDVDNTLLDNDRLKADLDSRIRSFLGDEKANEFWATYETVRKSEEYVDFPSTLEQFAHSHPQSPNGALRRLVMGMPFHEYVYRGSFDAIRYLSKIGKPVIVSDGDRVFQQMKIVKSGLSECVGNQVLLTVHKQDEMDKVFERFPSSHYAMVDDKTRILAEVGREYDSRVTTVLVCQGKYARIRASPPPDIVVPHIGDLVSVPREEFFEDQPSQSMNSHTGSVH